VPNEAIIEVDGAHLVYVSEGKGQHRPVEIESGVQGERYTEVRKGLKDGDQVVTFGSFFIDADHRLKGP
jgi:Cu(I)/Ag(I) efflux system membrane fusion protein